MRELGLFSGDAFPDSLWFAPSKALAGNIAVMVTVNSKSNASWHTTN
jgi:hypothetical protein